MKNIATLAIICFITSSCFSQSINTSIINSTGGSLQNGYYVFEWSVGEMALINEMPSPGNKLIITNGFLQPYTLHPGFNNNSLVFGIDEIKVFPNPASRYVEINFFTKQKGSVTLNFYDAMGKIIYSQEIISYGVDLIHRIPVRHLSSGSYFLQISLDADAGFVSKQSNYKIIKIE